MSTGTGNSSVNGITELSEYDLEAYMIKMGMLSPITSNIYIDANLQYLNFMDDDIDFEGIVRLAAGIVYFY